MRATIQCRGLVVADIDGIATLGDIPADEVDVVIVDWCCGLRNWRNWIRHRCLAEPDYVNVPCSCAVTDSLRGRVSHYIDYIDGAHFTGIGKYASRPAVKPMVDIRRSGCGL